MAAVDPVDLGVSAVGRHGAVGGVHQWHNQAGIGLRVDESEPFVSQFGCPDASNSLGAGATGHSGGNARILMQTDAFVCIGMVHLAALNRAQLMLALADEYHR